MGRGIPCCFGWGDVGFFFINVERLLWQWCGNIPILKSRRSRGLRSPQPQSFLKPCLPGEAEAATLERFCRWVPVPSISVNTEFPATNPLLHKTARVVSVSCNCEPDCHRKPFPNPESLLGWWVLGSFCYPLLSPAWA